MSRYSWILAVTTVVGFLGILNAGYLALTAVSGEAPVCNFIHGCDVVAASPYSRVFGIPLAIFGVFFYVVATGFALWGFWGRGLLVARLLLAATAVGFALSLYFLYLQAFVIEAYCEYCLFSLFDASALFVLALFLYREVFRPKKEEVVP